MITVNELQDIESKLRQLVNSEKLNPNSSYNEVVIQFWREYDRLGETLLRPNELTNVQTIDRAWRKSFRCEKGDEEGVKQYVKKSLFDSVQGTEMVNGKLRLKYG